MILKILLIVLLLYLSYKIIKTMDIKKSLEPIFFVLLAFSIPSIALFLFDYSAIKSLDVYKDFGNISILAILFIYVTVVVFVRIVNNNIAIKSFVKEGKYKRNNSGDDEIIGFIYMACIDIIVYGIIPIIITYLSKKDYLYFLGISFIWFLLLLLMALIGYLLVKIAKNDINSGTKRLSQNEKH